MTPATDEHVPVGEAIERTVVAVLYGPQPRTSRRVWFPISAWLTGALCGLNNEFRPERWP